MAAWDKARAPGSWSWSWRVVPCKLGKNHHKPVEQVPSPFSQDLAGRETLWAILKLLVTQPLPSLLAC